MRRNLRLWIVLGCWLCAGAAVALPATRKAGLWELTTTTTWQKPPVVPDGTGEPVLGGAHTKQVCLTQEMIDKYGALLPQSRGQCGLENKVIKPGLVTADYVCAGMMSGKGELVSRWSDPGHVKSSVHFVGTMRVGPADQPIEWTTESTAAFKSEDCGAVQPPALPRARR